MDDGTDKYEMEAVSKALDECWHSCGRIGEFIHSNKSEIMELYKQYYDEEENLRACMDAMIK